MFSCKYLMRLFLIMLKECNKRQLVEFTQDLFQLLQQMLDLSPWDKSDKENWQNLRQGLVIMFVNNK